MDVAAIDCEMIYTTGGMRVARVSVVDGSGAEVFDELVHMDPGVEVMCVYNMFIDILWSYLNASVIMLPDFQVSMQRTMRKLCFRLLQFGNHWILSSTQIPS